MLGMAKNDRLLKRLSNEIEEARLANERTHRPERRLKCFKCRTRCGCSSARRIVGKAEHLERGSNPRFVVTTLSAEECPAEELYEVLYCARVEMENRIKEQQLYLFADRTSCQRFQSNQTRLYVSSIAYVLLSELRRLGLKGTKVTRAQCGTIRTKLLKIGAHVRGSGRKIWISMSESSPYRDLLLGNWARLHPI
jgi:hypothetical protein